MMFEIRSPTNGTPLCRFSCAATVSPTSFETADDVVDLAEIGEVRQQEEVVRRAVGHEVDVDDVVAVLSQVAHDPAAALAGASGHDDAHRRCALALRGAEREPADEMTLEHEED